MSCPEFHGPPAVWRSMLRDLPQGDRARRVRRQGSVMTVSLEALAQEKEVRTSVDATVAGMSSIHPVEGRKPHEYTSVTDCYEETERGRLVIASESGSM